MENKAKLVTNRITKEDHRKWKAIVKHRDTDMSKQLRQWIAQGYSKLPKEAK